jgi:hypothetical protein
MKVAEHIIQINDPDNEGLNYELNTTWILYSYQKPKTAEQEIPTKEALTDVKKAWMPKAIIKFSTIAGFWYTLTHEFHKMQHNDHYIQYTFMREGCEPRWESYPKGGYIAYGTSDRNPDDNYVLLIECLMALIGEQICVESTKGLGIKGLTVCEENSFFQLRFWLEDINISFEKITLSERICQNFDNLGIDINKPSYKYFTISRRKQKSNEDLNPRQKARNEKPANRRRRSSHPTPVVQIEGGF